MLLLSLVLIAVNASIAYLGGMQLHAQFERQLGEERDRQLREFNALVERSFIELERITSLLPIQNAGFFPMLSYADRVARQLSERAPLLEIDWDVETIQFFTSDGKLAYSNLTWMKNHLLAELVEQSLATETTSKLLDCTRECRQYVVTPLLNQGEFAGVLLLGRSITEMVYTFRLINGADLAIISVDQSESLSAGESRWLPAWQRWVVVASNSEQIVPMLKRLSAVTDLEQLEASGTQYKYQQKHYDVLMIPQNKKNWEGTDDFFIISDISGDMAYIESATRQSLVVGVVGIVISESLLLVLLWGPMARLKVLADNLPMLAENATGQVRRELKTEHSPLWPGDEIDVAASAALFLAEKLETLNQEVESRTEGLIQRGRALARERDFIAGLLNSAQVVILTQDKDGRVLSLNPEGERVTGRDLKAAGQFKFYELLDQDDITEEVTYSLHNLRRGLIDSWQHDSRVVATDGSRRTISWIHSRLARRVAAGGAQVLSVGLDITEREEVERKLSWLADHDPLTELINRRRFQLDFEMLIERSLRYRHSGALLYLDLDQFKYINDTSGHLAGDSMLKLVAGRLRKIVRSSDLLARLGGDEFALAIPETDTAGVKEMADKILHLLQQIELPVKGRSHRISASIGIALFPEHGTNIHDLMANADLAMYQAKNIGRDRWHLFSAGEQVREQLGEQVLWKQKIEQALKEERFFLQFQPIMEISSGDISHYEVLVRMLEDNGETASPAAFIPVAEQTGLIHNIDRLVLQKAIEKLVELRRRGVVSKFSINLSGRVVDDPKMLTLLQRLLCESGLSPGQLLFEITETAALANIQAAGEFMDAIRGLGCQTALDDFGVGFSSFFYLKELPVDFIKIDGSFIRQLPHNRDDRIFVKAMAEVASGLGKLTIAEFVEDEETLQLLRELGVHFAQGYHIGRPVSELP